jgi:hypothetical protein
MFAEHLLFFGGLGLTALVFALLEVEIEGSKGWASGLPTWRYDGRFARMLFGGRTVTGYHVYAHAAVFLFLHSSYFIGRVPFTWSTESRILAFLILFWIIEDFLWFVVNPAYGVRGFRPSEARWHRRSWWWIMPREYWIFLPVAVALYLLGA